MFATAPVTVDNNPLPMAATNDPIPIASAPESSAPALAVDTSIGHRADEGRPA